MLPSDKNGKENLWKKSCLKNSCKKKIFHPIGISVHLYFFLINIIELISFHLMALVI
jgi:hypothetical protein